MSRIARDLGRFANKHDSEIRGGLPHVKRGVCSCVYEQGGRNAPSAEAQTPTNKTAFGIAMSVAKSGRPFFTLASPAKNERRRTS